MRHNNDPLVVKGWRYYNHAAVPTCSPHEMPDLTPIKDGSIWNMKGQPLLARYITDFDCNSVTSFWHIVKDGPFRLEELSKNYQKHIRKALERCEPRRINAKDYAEQIWEVTEAAYARYENADNEKSYEEFMEALKEDTDEYWGAFSRETGELTGWMSCENNGTWSETKKAKYHPELQSYNRPSDVLHYAVLNYYLNELGQKYITSGTRSINHKTNVQDYKINHWNFRKAYCKVHVIYNPKIKWIIKLLYPVRGIFYLFDSITLIHQFNSLLKLEELTR